MLLPRRPVFSLDDDQADVCCASKNVPFNMNQSFFQMITAATSNVRMGSRFDEDSDDEEEDEEADKSAQSRASGSVDKGKLKATDRKPWAPSFPKLNPIEETQGSAITDVHDDGPFETKTSLGSGPAPVMSRILEAEAQMNTDVLRDTGLQPEGDMFEAGGLPLNNRKLSELARKLMEIFGLVEMEDVIAEYPCWLLKSVLLQGYMYVTTNHICFYAYLPKKTDVSLKSGYLTKRGKSNVKFTRYWFILKGDVLSYFLDPSDLYFPNGHIDLRYGIQASLVDNKDGKESMAFTVTTDQRKYYFRADSIPSAKEWVKALQKVIFRTHNEGDSVKISIPVANVMDVEESPVLEFADTVKLKVVENDTYAIDEYFFSFFSLGNDALKVLQVVVEGSAASKLPVHSSDRSSTAAKISSSQDVAFGLTENVRATLCPRSPTGSSPRRSGESSREISRLSLKRSCSQRHSTDSTPRSPGFPSTTHISVDSLSNDLSSFGESLDAGRLSLEAEDSPSASSILTRNDVFQSPTIDRSRHTLQMSNNERSRLRKSSPDGTIRATTPSQVVSNLHGHSRYDSGSETDGPRSPVRIQEIVKASVYPSVSAASWAEWMKRRSKKMGTLLTSQPMGYLEKVSGMWTGGRRHYHEPMGVMPDEKVNDVEDEDANADALEHGDRFRTRFALPETERLTAVYFGYLHRVLPLYGKIYLSNRNFCFRSMVPGTKTKMVLPLKDIENVDKEKGFRFGYSGLVTTIRGHEELFFEFGQVDTRDDCAITLLTNIDDVRHLAESGILSRKEKQGAEAAKIEYQMLQEARQVNDQRELRRPACDPNGGSIFETSPIAFDDPHGSFLNFKPAEPMNITCLTIGSRGDVQPYIALCQGLMKDGHTTKIATHEEFRDWIESYGIQFAPVGGDPAELMQLCVEYGMFTVEFLRVTTSRMRGWLDGLLESAWNACQGSDLLIESPSAMAGIHIAEALGIPYFRAFTMPWTRTRAYPHAFAVPEHKMGGAYNYFSYVIIDNVFWKSTAGQINRWRKRMLNLPRTNLDKLQVNKVPFLYNFSPTVVAPPLDYSDWIRVTGYWFLDQNLDDWSPPKDLVEFIEKARKDSKKIVYVGFGSVTVADPVALTNTVVESVLKSDVRCILSKGWSDRLSKTGSSDPEVPLPPEIHLIKSCPHEWLFKEVDAACHHGGAGTTGASLRAGIPTIIKPFFGDQFFFGNRVEDLGVGVCIKKMNTTVFSKALWTVTRNERIMLKAQNLGEQIRQENGVENAIQAIYRDMEYACALIKTRYTSEPSNESEESWTFVGEEAEAEPKRVTGK